MKTHSILLVIAAVLLAQHSAPAQQVVLQPPERTVMVAGSAEVRVMPNEAIIYGAVTERDPKHDEAASRVNGKVSEILAFLTKAGVNPKDVQTDCISIRPIYHNQDRELAITGYEVRKGVIIRIRDISKFEPTLTGVIGQGMNIIDNVDLRSTDLRKHRDEARKMAVKAAREKAKMICDELGIKLGEAVSFSLDDSWGGGYARRNARDTNYAMQNAIDFNTGGDSEPSESFSPGQIPINASVTVTFRVDSPKVEK